MTNAARLQIVVAADTGDAERKLQHLGQQVQTFGQSFTQGLGIGAGLAALQTGLGMITGTFGALKGAVIDFNQQLDASRAAFARYFDGNTKLADSFLTTLKGFAATTPFEFKDLSQLAIKLQNANTNANDIIPTIKAIGNAASASGSLSQASLDRITLALTQMQMKGKVSGEEMLQMVEAGVPAWDLLAKATGKPIPVLQEMASKGQITSDVFVKAFHDMYENAGLMEGASKSLEGALSTIRDVGAQAFADIGRSVYDLATDGANALATFLSSEQFQAWANAAQLGVQAVVGGVRSLLETLAPVGQVLQQAFGQFTAGDFAGGFGTIAASVQNALGGALQSVQEFTQRMFGAGINLVGELAGGIVDGAQGILQGAIDTVASMIASFLIGNSPPPEGPLSQIRQGGANVIAAWGEGAASAADSAVKPAADKIAGGLDELKASGRGAEEAIREIGRAISEIDSASNSLKRQVDDVKDAYRDQLDPLEDQLKSLQNVKDIEDERFKLSLSLEEAQLRQAEIAAQGDPRERARLQTKLTELKARQDEVKLTRESEDLARQLHGTEKDRLKDKLESAKFDREEADLKEKLKSAKGDDKEKIRDRLEELKIRRQIGEAEEKERAVSLQRKQEDAAARKAELDAKRELDGLTDKTALAAIKQRQQELKDDREANDLAGRQMQLERDILALPVRQEIERIKAEQEASLRPLQEQLETYGRQKQDLSEQRQHWTGIKQEISAASAALKDQEAATKKAEKAAADAAKNKPTPGVDKNFTPDAMAEAAIAKAKEAGGRLAENLKTGFISWLTEKPLLSVGSIAGALFGAGQGAALGASLGSIVPVFGTAIGGLLGAGIGAAIGGIGAATLLGPLQKKIDEALGPFGPMFVAFFELNLRQAFESGGVGGAVGFLLERLGAAISTGVPMIAGKLSEWAFAFLEWAGTILPPLQEKLSEIGTGIATWIGQAVTGIAGKLLDWATAFLAWVGPAVPQLLTKLGLLASNLIEWVGSNAGKLADGLGKWALEFVTWIAPKIPPLLAELGKLLTSVTSWLVGTALPGIMQKLLQWGDALISWVAPRIGPLLVEVGKLVWALNQWFLKEGGPALVKYLFDSTVTVGTAMVDGIWKGLQDGWEFLKKGFNTWAQMMVKTTMEALGIASPSTVFAEIGGNIVRGLWDGILKLWEGGGDTLKGWFEGFGAAMQKAFGWTGGALSWVEDLKKAGSAILSGIWDGLSAYWTDNLSPWWDSLGKNIMAAFGWAGEKLSWAQSLTKIGSSVLSTLWGGVDAYWSGNLQPWFENLGTAVLAAFGVAADGKLTWAQKLLDAGKSVLSALWQGMSEMFGSEDDPKTLKGLFKQITDWIPDWIRNALSVKSPSRVMMEIGQHIVGGLVGGMRNKFPDIQSTIGEAIKHVKNWEGFNLKGKDLILGIQGLGSAIGGDEFGRVAAAVAHLETSGGRDMFEDEGTGRGPFQFSTPGQLDAFAKKLGVGLEEAGKIAIKAPMMAAKWALENYLGEAIRKGQSLNKHGADLAEYTQRYGQVSITPEKIRGIYEDLFPGLASGGIVRATPGGILARIAEGGRDEAVLPLPHGWQNGASGGSTSGGSSSPVETHHFVIQAPDGRTLEEWYVTGRELAVRRGRAPAGAS